MGFVAFSKPIKDLSFLNMLFSATIGLFFGSIYKLFLVWFSRPFNRDLKEKHGKKVVKRALENGLVYIFPFSVIAFFSRFFLGISLTTPLFSGALVISAISGAASINSLKEKPRTVNIITSFIISSVFSTLWIYYSAFAARFPSYAESSIQLLYLFLTGVFRI
jgi:flagellar biosynthesis protein FlhB